MILLVDCGSNKTPSIERLIDEYCDVETVFILDLTEEHLKDKKGVVFSGAPILVTEVDPQKYLDKTEWIKTTELPLFGICFGHQLIGLHFDAFASRMREDRDWQTIEAYEECILFNRLPNEVEMMEDHCESISIPPGFQLVASSDTCVNEVMQHIEKSIYGVQFHPEVSGNHGSIMIENFVNHCIRPAYH
jgi:GMP synthase (glutamine-hydrolysing)